MYKTPSLSFNYHVHVLLVSLCQIYLVTFIGGEKNTSGILYIIENILSTKAQSFGWYDSTCLCTMCLSEVFIKQNINYEQLSF